jgi:hypothetical protein
MHKEKTGMTAEKKAGNSVHFRLFMYLFPCFLPAAAQVRLIFYPQRPIRAGSDS